MASEVGKRGVSPLVKAFVILHAFLVLSWTVPRPAPAVANGSLPPTPANVARHAIDFALAANERFKVESPTRFYLLSTGLWQYWDMFAPNPSNVDIWFDARVTFASGRTETQPYPRMRSMPVLARYFKERYRKYMERVNRDGIDDWKRPTFAQRMAFLAARDPDDPPVEVVLRRHFRIVQGPDRPLPGHDTTVEFFRWSVDQARLRRDKGW